MDPLGFADPRTGDVTEIVDGRSTTRTIADALDKLIELGALTDAGEATIHVPVVQLPDGREVGSVGVGASSGTTRRHILMPSGAEASALDVRGQPVRLPVARLDGARASTDGTVRLSDGTSLRAVELVPVRLTQLLNEDHDVILHLALDFLRDAKPELRSLVEGCYRPVHEGSLPGRVALDYVAIARLGQQRLPMLKAIERHVTKQMPHAGRQTIANALAMAGLRLPRSGSRARPSPRRRRAATFES